MTEEVEADMTETEAEDGATMVADVAAADTAAVAVVAVVAAAALVVEEVDVAVAVGAAVARD